MPKTILFVHGRNWKPAREAFFSLWTEGLRHGIARDHPHKLPLFDACTLDMVYYGDLNNQYLANVKDEWIPDALADRRENLRRLKQYEKADFNEATYRSLPGVNPLLEALSGTFSNLLHSIRISQRLIELVAPDIGEYWNPDSDFGSRIRERMIMPLRNAMERRDDILVIAHSLGSMLAYDTFWKFSHTAEYRIAGLHCHQIDCWITLGSPLGDPAVKENLKGSHAAGARRYPTNIRRWVNLAAEDDFISHDGQLEDDYRQMTEVGLVESITDKRIYNLGMRNGKSHPHSVLGYLIHPETADLLAAWL